MTDTTSDPVRDALSEVTREELRDIGRRHRAGLEQLAGEEPSQASAAQAFPAARPTRNVDTQLAAFQAELPSIAAAETATVPGKDGKQGYKYSYAGLDTVSPVVLRLLGKHGLAWTCAVDITERGAYVLTGTLAHGESGTSRVSRWKVTGETPQAIGSSITYGRRYLLLAVTGVAPGGEDDDGAKAEEAAAEERMERRRLEALERSRPRPQPAPAVQTGSPGTGPQRAAVARAVTEGGNLGNGQRTGTPDPLPVPEDRGEASETPAQRATEQRGLVDTVTQAWVDDRAAVLVGTDPTAGLLPAATAYAELAGRDATERQFSDSERVPEAARGMTPAEVYMLRMHDAIKSAVSRDTLENIARAAQNAGVKVKLVDHLNSRWSELPARAKDTAP